MRDWIAIKRKSVDMTQAELSSKLGITESYLSLIEKNERQKRLDITLVVKLAEAFEMPITDVIAAEASQKPFCDEKKN